MRLRRPCGAIREKAKRLCKKGLLDGKNAPRCQSIKPDPQDFDEVKSNYCRKHHITIAELCARFERDNQLASELYRLALAATAHKIAHGLTNGCALECGVGFRQLRTCRRRRPGQLCAITGPLLVHSITLSALATSAGGTESPSCLAVLRLMDNSNLVTW